MAFPEEKRTCCKLIGCPEYLKTPQFLSEVHVDMDFDTRREVGSLGGAGPAGGQQARGPTVGPVLRASKAKTLCGYRHPRRVHCMLLLHHLHL